MNASTLKRGQVKTDHFKLVQVYTSFSVCLRFHPVIRGKYSFFFKLRIRNTWTCAATVTQTSIHVYVLSVGQVHRLITKQH